MSTPTGSGDIHRNDTTMMYAVHQAFQRDLSGFTRLVERGVTTDPAVRAGWERFKTFLHIHHTAEDTHLWPVLRAKLTGRPAGLAVLERMDAEHEGLSTLLEAVDAALADSVPADLLLIQVRRLSEALTAHCRDEEDHALPLVVDLLTEQEWTAFGTEQRNQLGFSGAASFFPWLLEGAPDDTRHTVLGYLPAPVRLLYRLVWRPRYLRGPRWQAVA